MGKLKKKTHFKEQNKIATGGRIWNSVGARTVTTKNLQRTEFFKLVVSTFWSSEHQKQILNRQRNTKPKHKISENLTLFYRLMRIKRAFALTEINRAKRKENKSRQKRYLFLLLNGNQFSGLQELEILANVFVLLVTCLRTRSCTSHFVHLK